MAGGRITIDLWQQAHAAEEIFVSWIGAQWIEHRIRFHTVEPAIDADHLSIVPSENLEISESMRVIRPS